MSQECEPPLGGLPPPPPPITMVSTVLERMLSSTSPEAKFLDEIQTEKSYEFSSLLFTVTSTAFPREFYFFKLTQPLMLS